ncbi:MAG: RidA family protein [Alphaproteobacteria bacterium]|nr:RidA family protein [Alphaproteobacteria bacterium]
MTTFDATVRARLKALNLTLPVPPQPAGAYTSAIRANGILYLSGQFPIADGKPRYEGRVGAELSEEEGHAAARLAALNVLAQIDRALGGFEALVTIARVEGHVSSAPGWFNHPVVLDGASELFKAVLDERAGHTRSAMSHHQLPWNLPVELVVTAAVQA